VKTPAYLSGYDTVYRNDARAANRAWFDDAGLGLFLHYGIYSLIGRHEWVQLREKIYVADYARHAEQFTADGFDAERIVDFARECGMRYINITTRHHDGFCLWETEETPFHSVNSPAKRDLVRELYEMCEQHGIGLFLYYSHGRDWWHPHAPNNDWGGQARPEYDPPEPSYAVGEDHNLQLYLDFMTRQVTELLTRFPNAAGIWLDGIAVPLSGNHSLFRCQELYDHIRAVSPHALVSYKQGLLGTEDFFTPEHYIPDAGDAESKQGLVTSMKKKIEVSSTMIHDPVSWGWQPNAIHRSVENLVELYSGIHDAGANLLINTGPMPDGSLDPVDVELLKGLGRAVGLA
jgi:alpha-L-fucosidase